MWYHLSELETALRWGLNVTILVNDNVIASADEPAKASSESNTESVYDLALAREAEGAKVEEPPEDVLRAIEGVATIAKLLRKLAEKK